MTRPLIAVLALAFAAVLTGCGSSPPTRFYTIDTLPPSAAPAYAGPPVRVDQIKIPPVLDRPEIVSEYAAGQLKIDDFNHWGAPLGQLLRASLAADLAARVPAPAVVPAEGPRPAGTIGLSVDILAVGTDAGGMTMDVVWTETRPAGAATGKPISLAHSAHLSAPDSAATPAGYAAGLSRMIGALADRMVAELGR